MLSQLPDQSLTQKVVESSEMPMSGPSNTPSCDSCATFKLPYKVLPSLHRFCRLYMNDQARARPFTWSPPARSVIALITWPKCVAVHYKSPYSNNLYCRLKKIHKICCSTYLYHSFVWLVQKKSTDWFDKIISYLSTDIEHRTHWKWYTLKDLWPFDLMKDELSCAV